MSKDEAIFAAVWLMAAAWCSFVVFSGDFWVTGSVFACQISGYTSLGFLGLSLLMGPLLRMLSWMNLRVAVPDSIRMSRNAGIAAGLAALLHSVVVFTTYLGEDWWNALEWPYLQSGLLSLAIFIILLIGSIKPLMVLLGWQLWKPFFRLSFAAAALTFHHMLYAPFSSKTWTLGLFAAGILLSLLRYLPVRPNRTEH